MNRWIWVTPFVLLSAVWTLSGGCRTVALPTFPLTSTPVPPAATATNTFTRTPTFTAVNTSTPTNTRTHTATFTPSNTPTVTNTAGGPTNTFTFTPTDTLSPTITDTPTDTPTTAPTNTPTHTPTSGGCPPGTVQTSFTFESALDCWAADAGTTIVTGISLSSAQVHTGTQSLQVAINNGAAVNQNAQIQVVFASPQNMAGAVISMWVYADASLKTLPDWNTAFQPFAQDPWFGNWQALGPTIPVATWTSTAVTLGAGATTIAQFGLQLTTVGPGASGNIYIDDVVIVMAPPPTATPTSTPAPIQTWGFEDGTQQGWVTAGGNVPGTTALVAGPGWNASLFSLNLTAPFTAQGQGAGIAQTFGVPLNLTGGGIRCYVWMDAGVSDGFPGGQIAPSDGTNTYWGFWGNLTQGSWTLLNSPASSWAPVNAASVTSIIIQAAMGGTGTVFTTGQVKFDQIEVY